MIGFIFLEHNPSNNGVKALVWGGAVNRMQEALLAGHYSHPRQERLGLKGEE